MDTLYVGDIPKEYHYARYGSNYIDLYDTDFIGLNTSYSYYRVYMYNNFFCYEYLTGNTNNFSTITISNDINVTDNIMYRRDMPSILTMTFIFCLCFTFLINLVTSFVKKGGLLNGLI